MVHKAKILVVDDEEIVRIRIGRVLAKEGYNVTMSSSGADALAVMEKMTFDLVLSDMVMEDMDGLALLKKVRRKSPGTIFMIITGQGSLATAIESMRLGAFDYLLKPCDDSELKLRIERGLKERRLLKKVESQNRKLEKMAITDSLTGLYSRSYFMEALDREFKHFNRYRTPLSFMMIDLDHFKKINDRFGHQTGDEVLKRIARKFMKIIREADVIGRYGGEEFGVIQPRTDIPGATRSGRRILSSLREDPEMILDNVKVRVSIGIATCPHKEIVSPSQLIKAADTALYQAKRAGRDRLVVYGAPEEKAKTL